MKTALRLIAQAIEIWTANALAALDPRTELRAENERLRNELDIETKRADYWLERTNQLLREAVTQGSQVKWLSKRNAYWRAKAGHVEKRPKRGVVRPAHLKRQYLTRYEL